VFKAFEQGLSDVKDAYKNWQSERKKYFGAVCVT
jgi:hypothetical protein